MVYNEDQANPHMQVLKMWVVLNMGNRDWFHRGNSGITVREYISETNCMIHGKKISRRWQHQANRCLHGGAWLFKSMVCIGAIKSNLLDFPWKLKNLNKITFMIAQEQILNKRVLIQMLLYQQAYHLLPRRLQCELRTYTKRVLPVFQCRRLLAFGVW